MRLLVKFLHWGKGEVVEICVLNCPVKKDFNLLFGWWFTSNIALGADIRTIVVLPRSDKKEED